MAISPSSPAGTSRHSVSTQRMSTPQIGVPIEPGLGGRSGWLNEATGDVSERPYPSRIVTLYFLLKACITSTGMADPPEQQIRSDERSYFSASGKFSRKKYIVGTPAK